MARRRRAVRRARTGTFAFSVAIAASVGLNALVSPILGALSDRGGGRRLPYLLFFTLLCIVPTAFIGRSPPIVGLVLFIVANFAYQAALIYYDATLQTVSYPATRGKLSGIGVAIGYCGTIFVGLLIFLLDLPVAEHLPRRGRAVRALRDPAVPASSASRRTARTPVPTTRDAARRWTSSRRRSATPGRPGLGRFLLGRFFYSDAVNTIIVVMAIVATEAMGLSNTVANLVLLSLAIVAVIASFGWGCSRRSARPETDA